MLLVEDDPDMRDMLSLMLELQGARVITAANGVEAYNLARTYAPCLIILDLMMPVMTGEEFRKVQLAHHGLRRIPVVVVSAHYDAAVIAKRMKARAYFPKPVELDSLSAFVAKICK